jgi:hypothetical protein
MLLLWIKVDSFISIMLPNLNPIFHLLALGAHHILHLGRIRVKVSIYVITSKFSEILGRTSYDRTGRKLLK